MNPAFTPFLPYRNPSERNWRIAGKSVQGMSHRLQNDPCQDSCGWFETKELAGIAVADGAGTAALGELGSAVAVIAAVNSMVRMHTSERDLRNIQAAEIALRAATEDAAKALLEEAKRLGKPIRDLATTLIVVLAAPQFVSVGQVGDGAVIVSDREFNLVTLASPGLQEYVNEPTFLTSANALQKAHFQTQSIEAAHVAAITDGLQLLSLRMPQAIAHTGFFTPIFKHLAELPVHQALLEIGALLASDKVAQRTDDDVTLVIASLPQNSR